MTSTLFATLGDGPSDMTFDSAGNLLVTAEFPHVIWSVAPDGTVTNFATSGLDRPAGIDVDDAGNVYVANFGNGTVRKFSSSGTDLGNFVTGLPQPIPVGFWSAVTFSIPEPAGFGVMLGGLALTLGRLLRRRRGP